MIHDQQNKRYQIARKKLIKHCVQEVFEHCRSQNVRKEKWIQSNNRKHIQHQSQLLLGRPKRKAQMSQFQGKDYQSGERREPEYRAYPKLEMEMTRLSRDPSDDGIGDCSMLSEIHSKVHMIVRDIPIKEKLNCLTRILPWKEAHGVRKRLKFTTNFMILMIENDDTGAGNGENDLIGHWIRNFKRQFHKQKLVLWIHTRNCERYNARFTVNTQTRSSLFFFQSRRTENSSGRRKDHNKKKENDRNDNVLMGIGFN
jgi:hypothetical protein